MQGFVVAPIRSRVVFGRGVIEDIKVETAALGARCLILSTPGQLALAQHAAERLGNLVVGVHAEAEMHVPRIVADRGIMRARQLGADVIVAIGGGSTTGLAKVIALETDLPILAIPTTYAGSEMTSIWGISENGVKRTGRDDRVLPKTVIYDPDLTLRLPAAVSSSSGLNAMAHCIEALYAIDGNPLVSILAEEGIRALALALPRISANPDDRDARDDALYGAWLSGTVLGAVAMALHHKLCHTLGGTFGLPHADTHAAVLPHALAYNAPYAPAAVARVAAALRTKDAPRYLFDLLTSLGLSTALRDLGMPEAGVDRAVELALTNPYPNPAPLVHANLERLVRNAWAGVRP